MQAEVENQLILRGQALSTDLKGSKPFLLIASFMQNESIINCQIEETIKQVNPRPLGFSIETIRFTKLVGKVHTTPVLVVCRQKGWDILVLKHAIRLHSWHLVAWTLSLEIHC